jgi:hypothetical protein
MTRPQGTNSRLRRGVEELFGMGLAESQPGTEAPPVAKYVLALIVATFTATAWYAASIDLGFSADGAPAFVQIVDQSDLGHIWSRRYGNLALLWPALLAAKAAVTSVPVLNALFQFGLYLPFLLSFLMCWYASRSLNDDALLLFPLASYLLVSLPAASILVGSSHVVAVAVWPILFLLLRPRLTPMDGIQLIVLLALTSRSYETALASLGVFLCILAARLWVGSPRSRLILLVAMAVVLIGLVINVYWALIPARAPSRVRFVDEMVQPIRRHPMLIVAAGSMSLLAVALCVRRFRALAFLALLVAAGSIPLPLSGRVASAHTSFALRTLTLTLLPVLLIAAMAWHFKRPRLLSREWILAGTIFGLLSIGYAASWTEWRDFRRSFRSVLGTHSGYIAVDDTPIARNRQRWPWTAPLLSVLWSRGCVRAVILNSPGQPFEPFDPYGQLPLQRYVAYAPPFAAATPNGARCH